MAYQSSAFAALADPTRAKVFDQLTKGPLSVAEIARAVPVTRPAVSQHLRVLLDAKLVAYEKAGTRHVYRLDVRGLAETRDWLNRFWGSALDSFKAQIESTGDPSP
jgi:DNA-binding transcriptional ArsR family regulator